ncbi:UNVERIFIED_CONTAM: hypothetical protein GTU68_064043 [Idotea baltica]|nr:hypothetical protein [Idotea baltica]
MVEGPAAAAAAAVFSSLPGDVPRPGSSACPFCGYRTTDVRRHIRFRHTGERPFPCPLCPKRFVEKVALVRHLTIHTGEKPFQCHKCLKRFNRKSSLNSHWARKVQCLRPPEEGPGYRRGLEGGGPGGELGMS